MCISWPDISTKIIDHLCLLCKHASAQALRPITFTQRFSATRHLFSIHLLWKPVEKNVKFTLSIAVHTGGLAENDFWLVHVETQKKQRIREQLNYFWNMCPNPFSWAKMKNQFLWQKSRRPLLARAALSNAKHDQNNSLFIEILTSVVYKMFSENPFISPLQCL